MNFIILKLAKINKNKVREELHEGHNTFEDFIKLLKTHKKKNEGWDPKQHMLYF